MSPQAVFTVDLDVVRTPGFLQEHLHGLAHWKGRACAQQVLLRVLRMPSVSLPRPHTRLKGTASSSCLSVSLWPWGFYVYVFPLISPRCPASAVHMLQDTHLVDEGREPAVEALDLLLLLMLHALSIGVDLQVEGSEQALIDRDCGDAGGAGPTDASRAVSKAASTGARAEDPVEAAAAEAP